MLQYQPIPVLFQIGQLRLYTHGFMMAVAFIVGTLIVAREAKRRGKDQDTIYSILFWIILGALIGARIGWVIEHYAQLSSFVDVFKIWQGGIAFYPGLLGAVLFSWIYMKKEKLNFWQYADIFAIGIPLGHAIGRIGCFLNWDDYGIYSNLPWAVKVGTDMPRHPTQLYSVIALLLIFFFIYKLKDKELVFGKPVFHGFLFFSYLAVYAVFRFLIEFIRDNNRYFGLTASQYIAIVLFIITSILMYRGFKHGKI